MEEQGKPLSLRLRPEDRRMLDALSKAYNAPISTILRMGIKKMYDDAGLAPEPMVEPSRLLIVPMHVPPGLKGIRK